MFAKALTNFIKLLGMQSEKQYQITDHRLDGVDFYDTQNKGNAVDPRYLIIHYTASGNMENTIRHFQSANSDASAHIIIDQVGNIAQMVRFDNRAWHAGASEWDNLRGLNLYSIGIELVNWGKLDEVDGKLYTWAGQEIENKYATFKDGDWWHNYTQIQIDVCFNVAKAIFRHYNMREVLGHNEISPTRKQDPGPLFDLDYLRNQCHEE